MMKLSDIKGRNVRIARASLAAAVLLGVASHVAAEEPPAIGFECPWDSKAQRFSEAGDAIATVVPGGNQFAVTSVFLEETEYSWMYLHHCPSDTLLSIKFRNADHLEIESRFNTLIDSNTAYSMDQIGADLSKRGAIVKRSRGDIGRCDCETLKKEGYLE
ncbi:hypothetical protein [Halovulum sp. GXIMD14793]